MSFFARLFARRLVRRAVEHALAGDEEGAVALLSGSSLPLEDLLVAASEALLERDDAERAEAMAARVVARLPKHWNGRLALVAARAAQENLDGAIELLEAMRTERPSEAISARLAELYLRHDWAEDAEEELRPYETSEDVETCSLYVRAAYDAGEFERVLPVLDRLTARIDARRRSGLERVSDDERREEDQLLGMRDDVIARLGGHEQVVVDHAVRRQLDSRAAVNFKLLAGKLMVESEPLTTVLRLASQAELVARAQRLAEAGDALGALVQRGTFELRSGDFHHAEATFSEALERDGEHFGALLGFAAARRERQALLQAAASKLPKRAAPSGLEQVVPDWPNLTEVERRAVLFQLAPFARFFPELLERGARIRLLPFDVRPSDLPELSELQGSRFEDDFRSGEALLGVCGETFAAASLGDLLDLQGDAGATFAHELAHLVHVGLPEETVEEIRALHASACENEWAWGQYQLSNEHEFFACTYVEYLLAENGLDVGRPLDDTEFEKARAFFRRLCG